MITLINRIYAEIHLKMKTFKFIIFALALLIINAISTSCKKEINPVVDPDQITDMNNLKVPEGFIFNTTSLIDFTITVKSIDNVLLKGVPLRVYTDFEDNGGALLFSGITNENGILSASHPLPDRLTQVVIVTTYLGLPDFVIGTIADGKVDAVLGGPYQSTFKSGTVPFKSIDVILQPIGTFNTLGVPDYLESINDVIDPGMLSMINATLPEYQNLPNTHPDWVDPSINYDIRVVEESQVWVTFVDEGACWTNTLGFYTYDLDAPPASKNDIETIYIILPNASEAGGSCGVGGLIPGNKVYLGQFQANTGIGLVMLVNGWSTSSHQVSMGSYQLYSNPNFNPQVGGPYAEQRQQFVMVYDDVRDLLLTGVEDQQRPQGDKDFNDLVFYITAIEVDGIDTTEYSGPTPNPTDTDNDGVPDDVDEYPTDPGRAFNVYYPAQNVFGTLAYEDLWPSKGDYDFNDMVVDYNIRHVTNALNQVVDVYGQLKLRAMGAGFQNGFGFQLGITAGEIANVELTYEDNSTVNQPLEPGQNKAVFIAWQNGFNLLPNQGGEVGVNTSHAESQVDPYELDFYITTVQPVRLSDLGVPPYNPFIFINQERTKEVHLPDFEPTTLASPSYFGTLDDASDPGNSVYYKTATGLPWAIHIGESLSYPVEKIQIISAYSHFAEWAQSGGTLYTDWYMDLPGYRIAGNIY